MNGKLFDLNGKTALITGSSRGLGLVFARGLAQAGATVVLNGRNGETLQQAVAGLKGEGLDATGYSFDVVNRQRVTEQVGPNRKRDRPHRHPGEQRRQSETGADSVYRGSRLAGGSGRQPDRSVSNYRTHPT